MAVMDLVSFLSGRYFEIPKYQRSYSWEKENVRDMYEDIQESIESGSPHYIGTFVLSGGKDFAFDLVDGQQRLTTIFLLIKCIVDKLGKDDKAFYLRQFIEDPDRGLKLALLGKDKEYFSNILKNKNRKPTSKSQRLLDEAYKELSCFSKSLKKPKDFLKAIERLQVMEMVEHHRGEAVRIFQTVNDRGKPLTYMEKAKSLLAYYSSRYLDSALDDEINDAFGEVFESYDYIKETASSLRINLITSNDFSEDNILRYHFFTFSKSNIDATPSYILSELKTKLHELKNKNGTKSIELKSFIEDYVSKLKAFSLGLKGLVGLAEKSSRYFKIFSILGISATLYPLMVTLHNMGLLEKKTETRGHLSYLDLIELIDVRIYKVRQTDPRAEILRFTYDLASGDKEKSEVEGWLLWYNKRWMSKDEFSTYMSSEVYGQKSLPLMFIDLCENIGKKKFKLSELKAMSVAKPTIEHVLARDPEEFDTKSHGFKDDEDYFNHIHALGNLTILSGADNSSAGKKTPLQKVKIYDKSNYIMNAELATLINANRRFHKGELKQRTKTMLDYIKKRWWC